MGCDIHVAVERRDDDNQPWQPVGTPGVVADIDAFHDFVLEHAPEFVANRNHTQAQVEAGDRGRPAAEVLAQLDTDEASGADGG